MALQRNNSRKKRPVFSFGDEDESDEQFMSNIEPLSQQVVDRGALTAKDFDPDRFLSSRRHLGLERLKVELNSHLKFLKSELVELINRDYQDFINLSTNLKGVDRAIHDLKRPLARMNDQVQDIRNQFQGTMDKLDEQLTYRAQLREKKACLKLMLNIQDSVSKVEGLLGIQTDGQSHRASSEDADATTDDSLGKQIERVAIEFNQMQHLVGRGKHLPFTAANEWRIIRIKDTLRHKLSNTLTLCLEQMQNGTTNVNTKPSLVQCLRTYALIDQTQVAERLIREQLVRPFLVKTITQRALDTSRATNIGHPLTVMLGKVLGFVPNHLQPILDITQKTLKSTPYEVLVNSYWVEVIEQINQECASIFAPGQTDTFHKNYTASMDFVSSVEALCSCRRSLVFLRNHPTYIDFMKRWQLPVYFQLRFREIVNGVEDLLNDPTKSVSQTQADQDLFLPGTQAVAKAIHQCWADNVFLPGLSHRFWKLTLQLLKRYRIWTDAVLANMTDTAATGLDKSSASKPQSEATTGDESKTLSQLIILAHDIDTFISQIKTFSANTIIPKLPESVQDEPFLLDSINNILQDIEQSKLAELQKHIIGIMSRRCIESLKQVRSITSQYRHTNKPPPTKPSAFILQLFRSFTTLAGQNAAWITPDQHSTLARGVVETVLHRYTVVISELLTNLRKTEDSLRKLNKGKKKPVNGDSMSDEDKIRLQMLLDVRQLANELDALQIDSTASDVYQQLYDVVRPFEPLSNTSR